ncbi:hypothetical protein L3Q82_021183 [Scortum barcoo]|uniref:Uncharacterized protein n=1 Tax=Scortum barcoo TaxID=214431 RepID=A0ACB8X3D8_9TELE|nr:hypothetical protein L3Q82_021183 [Scortum barcoo]
MRLEVFLTDQKIQLHKIQLPNISSGIKELTDSHAELKTGVDTQLRHLAVQLQQIISQLEELTASRAEPAVSPAAVRLTTPATQQSESSPPVRLAPPGRRSFTPPGALGGFLEFCRSSNFSRAESATYPSRGTHAVGPHKIDPGRASALPEGRGMLLLRSAGAPGERLPVKRPGSPGMRRALVSQIHDFNTPHRPLTTVTLSIKGDTTPFKAFRLRTAVSPGLPEADPREYPDLTRVPPCYHDLQEVFNKTKATSLPPHCPWDCAIDLLPGAPIPKARLYSISGPERKAMEEYIEASLRSGIIRPSSSLAGAGFFFMGKKDGSLRPCIDYSALNYITVKNRHPLPLISSAFEQLSAGENLHKTGPAERLPSCQDQGGR